MSYDEYLSKTGKANCKESWIDWQVDINGMRYMDALRASHDFEP